MPREQWCSDPLPGYQMRGPLRAVVVHHTGRAADRVRDGAAEVSYARSIRQLHLDRGWLDIGYHFLVMPSGRVFGGRPPWALGAHVMHHNTGTIGIALAGDFHVERPTAAALAAIEAVRLLFGGPARVPLVAHRDLADKPCPGANLYDALTSRRSAA